MIQNIKNNYKLLLLLLLYVASVLGLLYTDNFMYAESILETRFTILLFPLLLASSPTLINRKFLNRILIFFSLATFVGSLLLLIRAFVLYLGDFDVNHFIYINLVGDFHPSYFSMYVSFSIGILLFVPISFLPKWIRYFGIFFFSIMVFLLMSKMGVIALLLLFLYTIIVKSNWREFLLRTSMFVLFTGFFVFLVYQYSLAFQQKIDSTINEIETMDQAQRSYVSSTGMRILAWRVSMDIIEDNFFLGVGTGDAGDKLLEASLKRDWNDKMHGLNAHNQFLQTFIALGIVGLLILLLVIFYPLFLAIKQKEHIFILFFILVLLNFFVESMLQRQMGVIFYAVFSSLIYANLAFKPIEE